MLKRVMMFARTICATVRDVVDRDVVDLPARDALRDLGRGQATFGVHLADGRITRVGGGRHLGQQPSGGDPRTRAVPRRRVGA